jgi:DNA gyrase/topoisomerase IV subunit A
MTKTELEAKIEALQTALETKTQEQNAYRGQIDTLKKQLADLNKPKLTDEQFDELQEAIEKGVMNYDFSDTDLYSIDYGIDYDGRVHCESFDFDNADDLAREIYEYVSRLFAESTEDKISIQEHLNQD